MTRVENRAEAALEADLEACEASWVGPAEFGEPPRLGDEVGLPSEWAVPWSDLMMVMFLLFVVLFVYQSAERELEDAFVPGPAEAPIVAPVIPTPDLDRIGVALREERPVKVSLSGSVLFELGEAELRPQARSSLDRLAAVLAGSQRPLKVVGHTDDFPIHNERFPTNWELSAARAAAVARYLIRRGELDPARFTIAGRSLYEPTAPNDTPANKARNRRVELLIEATRRSGAPS